MGLLRTISSPRGLIVVGWLAVASAVWAPAIAALLLTVQYTILDCGLGLNAVESWMCDQAIRRAIIEGVTGAAALFAAISLVASLVVCALCVTEALRRRLTARQQVATWLLTATLLISIVSLVLELATKSHLFPAGGFAGLIYVVFPAAVAVTIGLVALSISIPLTRVRSSNHPRERN